MTENVPTLSARAAVAARPANTAMRGGILEAFTPTNLDEAFRLANALSQAGEMIPKHFQSKPQAIMAALLHGASVGLAPMQALQYTAVINGRPSVWGDALPAMVMNAGHFIDCEVTGEGDAMVATATLTRADGRKIVRTFSMAEAKKAGLTGKQGPWQQYPRRMIQMRARAWAIRDGAPDALLGLSVAEEVQDYGPAAAKDVTPRAGRAVKIAPPAAVAAKPVVDDFVEAEPVVEAEAAPATEERASGNLLANIKAMVEKGVGEQEVYNLMRDQIEEAAKDDPFLVDDIAVIFGADK